MLEKEFISIIKPLHFISTLFCLRKFTISDRNVSPNSIKYAFCSAIGIGVAYFLLCSTLISLVDVYNISIFYVYVAAYSQYCINYTILCIFNLYQSKCFVQLLLKLQTIDRFLYDSNESKRMKLLVWTLCILLLSAYGLFITFKLLYDPLWSLLRVSLIFTPLIFDIELTYSIFFVYFLACKMRRWSEILQVDEDNPSVLQDEVGITLVEMLFSIYEKLLDTFVLMKRVTQFLILLHFVLVFIQSMTYIAILILMTQSEGMEPTSVTSHACGVVLWLSKAIFTEATVCITYEILYRRIVSAQIAVVSSKHYYKCQRARRILKNIRRLNQVKFSQLNVYGIFSVNGALPLRLGGLIADYTVILLQFAFLKN